MNDRDIPQECKDDYILGKWEDVMDLWEYYNFKWKPKDARVYDLNYIEQVKAKEETSAFNNKYMIEKFYEEYGYYPFGNGNIHDDKELLK